MFYKFKHKLNVTEYKAKNKHKLKQTCNHICKCQDESEPNYVVR